MKLVGRPFRIAEARIEDVLSIVTKVSSEYGFDVTATRTSSNTIEVQATRRARWSRILFRRLLQRVTWTLSENQAQPAVVLVYDRRWFGWYRTLILLVGIPVGLSWCAGFVMLFQSAERLDAAHPLAFIAPWVGIFLMLIYAANVLAIADSLRFVEMLRLRFKQQHFVLDSLPPSARDRVTASGLMLLSFMLVATIPVLMEIQIPDGGGFAWARVMLVSALFLHLGFLGGAFGMLYLGTRRHGADDRFAAAAPTLNLMVAILSLLVGQVGFQYWRLASLVYVARRGSNGNFDDGLLDGAVDFAIATVVMTAILAAGFLFLSLKTAMEADRVCRRIGREVLTVSATVSASGRRFLKGFRVSLVIVWLCYSTIVLLGSVLLLDLDRVYRRHPNLVLLWPPVPTSSPTADSSVDHGSPAMGVFLYLWARIVPAAVLVSLLHFAWTRSRERKRIIGAERVTAQKAHALAPIILALERSCPDIDAVLFVTDERAPIAAVRTDLGLDNVRAVEISRGTVGLLEPNELKAIIAHELAHHILGHSRRRRRLQWLGRLTLVGETFVGSLEDSFGYELDADRIAVERFSVRPHDLRAALVKLQVASQMHANTPSTAPSKRLSADRAGMVEKSRMAIRTWWALYTGHPPVSYWHPALQRRIEALEAMTTSPDCLKKQEHDLREDTDG